MTSYLAIFGWPVVAIFFFTQFRLPLAICVTVIAGYLFLPSRFRYDLPLLPTVDKVSVPSVAALLLAIAGVGVALQHRKTHRGRPKLIPRSKLVLGLIGMLLLCGFATAQLNDDILQYGPRIIRSLRTFDGFSSALTMGITVLPLLLGYSFLARPEDHRIVLICMVVLGAGYSILALYEIRMSPQLNRTLYGYFPHSWVQHKRGGGWRPIVFLEHGLFVGIFLAMALLSAVTLAKQATDKFAKNAKWIAVLTGITLVLSSNLGATAIVFLLVPVLLFLSPKGQTIFAAGLAMFVLLYPFARGSDLVPTDRAVELARMVSDDRADSLQFRFDNEDLLLAKARERPVFGWGGWTRARVYDERGEGQTITDGHWVIIFGEGGWVRYIAEMGLLGLPIIFLAIRRNRYDVGPVTAGLAIVLSANLVDLLPNAGISPVTWMMAGAIWGRLALGPIENEETDPQDASPNRSPYTRQKRKIDRVLPTEPADRAYSLRQSSGKSKASS